MAISIITAIHNALPMNRLFWEALSQNTRTPFELVLVDNHSTDGSETFFKELAQRSSPHQKVVYLRNEANLPYPVVQKQGMARASHENLFFLNNDIWTPPGWELPLLEALQESPWQAASPSGEDAQPTLREALLLKRRWVRSKRLSRVWALCLGKDEYTRLWKSLRMMYGDLGSFTPPTRTPAPGWMPGIKGDVVAFRRALVDKVPGIWDERIQAADWHLYLLVAAAREKDPAIPLPRIVFKSYVHHFGRYSTKLKYEPHPPGTRFSTIEEVWGPETVRRLWWAYQMPSG